MTPLALVYNEDVTPSNLKTQMKESFLIYKLHRSLILKNQFIISPYLADDFEIIGAKPKLVIGNNDKDLLLNWMYAVEFGGDKYNFKSAFTKFNIEGEIKRGLCVEYYVGKERWLKLDVHFNFREGKIYRLFNTVKECSSTTLVREFPPSPGALA